MEFLEVLKKRRSIRKYINQEISKENIEKIIYAGTLSPSAHFREPWEVIVLKEKKKEIVHLIEKYADKLPNDQSILKTFYSIDNCDTLLLIYCNNFEQFQYNLLSIGAMIENMLLQATELGIGSLWIGNVCPVELQINSYLGIDSNTKKLVSAVALGYSNQEVKNLTRKGVSEIIEYID